MKDISVTLSDYALAIECAVLAWLSYRKRIYRLPVLFLMLSISSFAGGTYHGFFSLADSPVGGWICWMLTMGAIGLAAIFLAAITMRIWPTSSQSENWILRILAGFWVAYILYVYFVNYRFIAAILFYLPALLALAFVAFKKRNLYPSSTLVLISIGWMILASLFQQLRLGINDTLLDHNTIYHLQQFCALILFKNGLSRIDPLRL